MASEPVLMRGKYAGPYGRWHDQTDVDNIFGQFQIFLDFYGECCEIPQESRIYGTRRSY